MGNKLTTATTVDTAPAIRCSKEHLAIQWHVYASLNTLIEDESETKKREEFVRHLVANAKVNHSIRTCVGGYRHKNGAFTTETSLDFILVGANRQGVEFFAKILREQLNQESVLITYEPIEYYYLFNDAAAITPTAATDFDDASFNETESDFLKEHRFLFTSNTFSNMHEKLTQFKRSNNERFNKGDIAMAAPDNSVTGLDYQIAESYTIYIGLEQRRTISDAEAKALAAQTIVGILSERANAYSLNVVYGGYEFEDGFFEQDSLQISLVGACEDEVRRIAEALCRETNQEIAFITKSYLESAYFTVGS